MRDDEKRRWCSLFLPAAGTFRETHWKPRADVYSTPEGWLVKLDIAGVRPQDLQLLVSEGRVIVRGVRRDSHLEHGFRSHLLEISYSRFERVIELPVQELSRFDVQYQEGMLLVRIYTEVQNR